MRLQDMSRARKPILILAGLSLAGVTACTSPAHLDGADPNQKAKQGALLGGVIGAGLGALLSDDKGKGAVIGGAVGAAGGAVYGSVLDKQEAELRQSLGNDDVTITNTGDRLTVANNLQSYPDSNVQIVGHTDNSGGAAYNQALSERRANAVADVLMEGGVAFQRIQTFGRGEDQPVASNLTEEGKAQNRRVEIVILPTAV